MPKYKKYARFLKHVRKQPLTKRELRGLSVEIELNDEKSSSLTELREEVDLRKNLRCLRQILELGVKND